MSVPHSDALVFFGASGDLAYKMIFPALQAMVRDGQLQVPVIGVAKAGWTLEQLRERARQSLAAHPAELDPAARERLLGLLRYIDGDYQEASTFVRLRQELAGAQHPLHYLAIPPPLFPVVVQQLERSGCATGGRVVVEKPFGRDLASAQALNQTLHQAFDESDVFRIDHFLGKEAVQNLAVLRFANTFFDAIWSRDRISSVQITMAETFGVAGRGKLYEELGAVRDVVQNHLLQVLGLLAMEPPDGLHSEALRDQIASLFRQVKSLTPTALVRGQFRGYRQEPGVAADSSVETFAALRFEIDSPRWRGVPFLVRTGKCLPVTLTQVDVQLRPPPSAELAQGDSNDLRLRLSPTVSTSLGVRIKSPGEGLHSQPADLTMVHQPGPREMTAYERLLRDAMAGDATLFAREDAVEEAWRIVAPILGDVTPVHLYEPGSWGPPEADRLAADVGGWVRLEADAQSASPSVVATPS